MFVKYIFMSTDTHQMARLCLMQRDKKTHTKNLFCKIKVLIH